MKIFNFRPGLIYACNKKRRPERVSHMLMRVAVGIHGENIEAAIETYHLLSEKWFTYATPTLFNAGTPKPQLSSCFLITMREDSIDGIYDTRKQCAKISQSAGGIGLSIHDLRSKGSFIKGTNGTSNGIVPMLRNFDMTARYVDQGGGKKKDSIIESQIETGVPYMLYKDACNKKSNQKNLGTIRLELECRVWQTHLS